MNKKKTSVKKRKTALPGNVREKLSVGVKGNPKLNKPKRRGKA